MGEAPLLVEVVASTCFGQNGYLVIDRERRAAVVVDPGIGCARAVRDRLAAEGARLDLVLLTHEHFDHMGSLEEVRSAHGARVVSTRACSEALPDPKRNLSAYHPGMSCSARPADLLLEDVGPRLEWAGHSIELHPTPGHSPSSICIEIEGSLFTGDTLIPGLRTVTKLPGADRAALGKTLDFIFGRFPPGTWIRPGHGPTVLLGSTCKDVHL